MEPLSDRAARAADHHPATALSLGQLARLVQESGARVPDQVLLRALQADPERFRIVDPWKGPWSRLRTPRWSRPAAAPTSPEPEAGLGRLLDGPRVIPGPGISSRSGGVPGSAADRLRRTLIRLGWSVDDDSPVDLARWHRLVLEGRRVGARLAAGPDSVWPRHAPDA